jgi:hypothetical protein
MKEVGENGLTLCFDASFFILKNPSRSRRFMDTPFSCMMKRTWDAHPMTDKQPAKQRQEIPEEWQHNKF